MSYGAWTDARLKQDADGNVIEEQLVLCKVTNVNYRTQAGRMLLTQLNLTLNAREMYAIIGPSGSGKSTLMKAMNNNVHYFLP